MNEVMEILKADTKANLMIKSFEIAAENANITGEEYEETRKTMLMIIIANTPAAMTAMANEVWEGINEG